MITKSEKNKIIVRCDPSILMMAVTALQCRTAESSSSHPSSEPISHTGISLSTYRNVQSKGKFLILPVSDVQGNVKWAIGL